MAVRTGTPASIPVSPSALHPPLVHELARFQRSELLIDRIIFHGCSAAAPHIDVAGRRLMGARKWLSSDAIYASDYAGGYGGATNNGLLWVCRVKQVVPALVGSQSSLIPFSPWGSQFPRMLPDEFERYACHVLGAKGSVALLDHQKNVGYGEILITSPEHVLEVLAVHPRPRDRKQAHAFAQTLNEQYADARA